MAVSMSASLEPIGPSADAAGYPQGGLAEIQRAWRILAAGAPKMAAALIDIAENGQSEYARVTAAMAVLDRIGLGAQLEVGITSTQLLGVSTEGESQIRPADAVRARLRLLKAQSIEMAAHTIEGEIEEGGGGATVIALHPGNG